MDGSHKKGKWMKPKGRQGLLVWSLWRVAGDLSRGCSQLTLVNEKTRKHAHWCWALREVMWGRGLCRVFLFSLWNEKEEHQIQARERGTFQQFPRCHCLPFFMSPSPLTYMPLSPSPLTSSFPLTAVYRMTCLSRPPTQTATETILQILSTQATAQL